MKRHRPLVLFMASTLVATWLFVTSGPTRAQCEAGRQFAAPALQTVVVSNIEVSFANFSTTEVHLVAAFGSIGGPAAAPLRC